jgi:hypothetical protein
MDGFAPRGLATVLGLNAKSAARLGTVALQARIARAEAFAAGGSKV